MAKALRQRVGNQYTGTQRTRNAVHGECTVELAKWTLPIISLCREPYEAKVSRTGLTGGMGRRTVRQRALCLPSDNCLAPKTGYNAPLPSHCEGAFCHDSTSILLSARGLGTPVAVCHAVPRLARPRRDAPAKASQAHHAAPPALHRPHTVCGPDAQAPLCPVCARSGTSQSAPSRTTRPHTPDPPASPHGGHLAALLSP